MCPQVSCWETGQGHGKLASSLSKAAGDSVSERWQQCSGREGPRVPVAEGLRVLTSIYSFIIYVIFTVHYLVPGTIPDVEVMRVNKAGKFLAFREPSWKHVNVRGSEGRSLWAIGHICYRRKTTSVMSGTRAGKSGSMEMKSLPDGEREAVMWRFGGRVFQVKGSAVAAVLMQDYSWHVRGRKGVTFRRWWVSISVGLIESISKLLLLCVSRGPLWPFPSSPGEPRTVLWGTELTTLELHWTHLGDTASGRHTLLLLSFLRPCFDPRQFSE